MSDEWYYLFVALPEVRRRAPKGARPHSLFRALELGLVPDQFLEDAWAVVEALDRNYPRKPKHASPDPSWRHNTNPGFDNVVRAYEEDR